MSHLGVAHTGRETEISQGTGAGIQTEEPAATPTAECKTSRKHRKGS